MRSLRFVLPLLAGFLIAPLPGQEPKAGTVVKLDKLKSATPENWKSEKPFNRLRTHQFRIPGPKGAKDAELAILPDVKGTVEQNHARWKDQFVPPDGKTVDDLAKTSKFMVGKAKVDVLDMRGTWVFKERPFDPKSREEVRPDSRVLFVIFDTGDENFHIRLAGPAATVDPQYQAFMDWLKNFK